jgi:hypothetical protein
MSKAGTDSSVSGERGDTAGAAAITFASASVVASAAEPSFRAPDAGGATADAAVAALVSTPGSRRTCAVPKTRAAPHAATSVKDGTAIRAIDVAVMIRDRGQIVGSSPKLILRRFVPVIKSA